jgi:uncharacterized membrane-anchored protein YhcB (DUF1043 family)
MQIKFTQELLYLCIGLIVGIVVGINLAVVFKKIFGKESGLVRQNRELQRRLEEKDQLIQNAVKSIGKEVNKE